MTPFERLTRIVETLCSENGCPWDRAQTYHSLRSNLIEETYEIIEAIETDNLDQFCEELGDLLSVIMLLSQIAKDDGDFDIDQVINTIADKLVRRHPHVFGDLQVDNANQVLRNWEEIKLSEKGYEDRKSALDGVPVVLPSLQRAQKLQKKAARVGFDWENVTDLLPKLREEIREIEECLETGESDQVESGQVEMEVGDLLFTVVNLARVLNIEAEDALRQSNRKFERRFQQMEAVIESCGQQLTDYNFEQLDQLWEAVKAAESIAE